MSAEIRRVDPYDDGAVDAWHAVYLACHRADRGPEADPWQLEEQRRELQEVTDRVRRLAWNVVVDQVVVGCAWAGLPLKDNTHRLAAGVYVLPTHRRRGLGSQVLAMLEGLVRDEGRSVIGGPAWWPYDLGPEGRGSAGVEFALAHGFEVALAEVRRLLRLPADLSDLPAAGAGYRLQAFLGPIPEDLVEGWAVLDAEIDTAAPTGDLDIEPRVAAVADVRETEALVEAQQRMLVNAVAVDAAGEVAAYTQMAVPSLEPVAYQWGTMVRAQDRGHRLGLAVKAAALRLLQAESPRIAAVATYNAEANTHMIAINEALGFVPVERLGELQKRLSGQSATSVAL